MKCTDIMLRAGERRVPCTDVKCTLTSASVTFAKPGSKAPEACRAAPFARTVWLTRLAPPGAINARRETGELQPKYVGRVHPPVTRPFFFA